MHRYCEDFNHKAHARDAVSGLVFNRWHTSLNLGEKKKKKKGGSVESADGGEGRKEMGNAAASKRAQEHDTRRLCSVDLLGREARVGRESAGTCVFQREYKKGGTTARKNKNIKK